MSSQPLQGAALALLVCMTASTAAAQMEDMIPTERKIETAEDFAFEMRGGPYVPNFNDSGRNGSFDNTIGDDSGLMWEIELDVIAFKIPDVLDLGGGALIGWAGYGGNTIDMQTFDNTGQAVATDEESNMKLVPMALMGVARLDVLARKLRIPFVFAGKLGYQWTYWSVDPDTPDAESSWPHGIRWGLQAGLDLDIFEPAQARMLDEEWGINHSFILFEYYAFVPMGDSPEVGADTWSLGLGFMF